MRVAILLIMVCFGCHAQSNLVTREIFQQSKRKISYSGNRGLPAASTIPNTPVGGPFTTFNGFATRGAQGNLYPVSNGMTMSPDGTKVYAVNHNGVAEGFTNDAVTQFNLSTPWDLTTMSTKVGNSISMGSFPTNPDISPQGAFFSPNGLNLYVSGATTNRVYRFTLTTPYEIATASPHSSWNTNLNSLMNISFSPDGTKMFLVGLSNSIRRFRLSTPWDILTSVNEFSSLVIGGNKVFFKEDGSCFYSDNNAGMIIQYNLGVPWDLSSLTSTKSSINLNTLTPTGGAGGIYVNPAGTYLFISNFMSVPVKRFELSKPFKID